MNSPGTISSAPVAGGLHSGAEQSSGFNLRLEALRGVAAMAVALSHAVLIVPAFGWRERLVHYSELPAAGRIAVTIFFVLSGFVLGLSLRRGSGTFASQTLQFSLRRFFRIYPVFLLSTIVIVVFLKCFHPVSPVPFNSFIERSCGTYHHPISFSLILKNLLFREASLNGVTWTLCVEMECSLLLPFLHWLASRLTLRQNILLLAAMPVLGMPLHTPGAFMFMFFAGYLLPVIGPGLFLPFQQKPFRTSMMLLSAVALMVLSRVAADNNWVSSLSGRVTECVGASCLIGALVFGPELGIFRLLDFSVVRFYGRISYSFYLWQSFILYIIGRLFSAAVPTSTVLASPLLLDAFITLCSILTATLVAWLSYRFVEKTFIQLSKMLCSEIRARERSSRASGSSNRGPDTITAESPKI